MFKKLLLLATGALLLFACKDDQNQSDDAIIAKGGVRYGGEFRFMSSEKVSNLFPLKTTDVYANRVASQIFEGLLKIDPASTEVIPSIAKSFTVSEESRVFTFELRDDVLFHDDPCFSDGKGRKVTANDFKYCLEFACSDSPLNDLSWLLKGKVKGSQAYYDGKADKVEGIQVIDDYTLKIELEKPFSGFSKVLTHTGLSVFPKEAMEKYGEDIGRHPVGTGPFKLETFEENKIVLTRNNHYWDKDEFGNQLPFLDKVVMTYSKDKTDELLSFRREEIDLVLDIPVEEVENVLGTLSEAQAGENVKHKVDSKSSMSITYYGFAHKSEVFSKKEVREAFNIAIDRETIIETWLEGEGWAALHGFVPKMKDYPADQVNGFKYNVAKAKELMKKAGYPDGKGFPTIDLWVNALEESGTHKLAKAVSFSLKQNLGVNVNIRLCTIEERDDAIRKGEAIFWRTGWVADYPDPENFLNLFYGGNVGTDNVSVNPFKYNNPEFDALFEKALAETDEKKRMELLAQCDQMIINDAVVMPLLTDDFVTMVNLKVRKFTTNEMEQLNFSRIFIKELKNNSEE
ncbi:MAG: ABC transporter substrate-binding protein [Brumimicrobium sp.]|nr:ABC transporter substrate-binding protein [Brumimicrobium sp.]